MLAVHGLSQDDVPSTVGFVQLRSVQTPQDMTHTQTHTEVTVPAGLLTNAPTEDPVTISRQNTAHSS